MTKSGDYLNDKARDILPELAKTVAMLSADAVQQANSGHPGLPMGADLSPEAVHKRCTWAAGRIG